MPRAATRADCAEVAAAVLTAENQASRVYELAGDTAYTLATLVAEISRQSGKNIRFLNLPEAEYRKILVKVDF